MAAVRHQSCAEAPWPVLGTLTSWKSARADLFLIMGAVLAATVLAATVLAATVLAATVLAATVLAATVLAGAGRRDNGGCGPQAFIP
jgi:hypothetical protein